MKKYIKNHWLDILYLAAITFILMIPYFFKDLLPLEHDTIFHVSRIEQLSRSISEGNWFPAIYPYENIGYGYASPLFYSDVLLIPAALLHLAGAPLTVCYKFLVVVASFVSAAAMFRLAHHISGNRYVSWLASAGYMFANYHITDVYVRGALGEIFAMMFLPIVVEGMYSILWKDEKKWWILTIGLTGLAISHDLTFLMGVILCVILFLIKVKSLTKEKFLTLGKGVLFGFLLTAFFTLPMIEQLTSQKFVLGAGENLGEHTMALWQFFINRTIFGLSSNTLKPIQRMTVNVGWFLEFAPLLYIFFDHNKKKHPFVLCSVIIGYIFMLLPSEIIPWSSLTMLRTLQFPWRLNTISIVFLSVPAAYGVLAVCKKKFWIILVETCMVLEALVHVRPVFLRTFGMTSSMTWADILNGALTDPWYNSYYLYDELAGADYLPISFPNYRTYGRNIKDDTQTALDFTFEQKSTTLTFEATAVSSDYFILPITYYKGYQVYYATSSGETKVNTFETSNGLVACSNQGAGTYICRYVDTPVRKISMGVSLASLIGLIGFWLYRRKTKKDCASSV